MISSRSAAGELELLVGEAGVEVPVVGVLLVVCPVDVLERERLGGARRSGGFLALLLGLVPPFQLEVV